MTALPSFVELMATLGLNNKSSPSPTQGFSSPAIVVSPEYDPSQEHIASRIRVARYSPYGAPMVSLFTPARSNRTNIRWVISSSTHRDDTRVEYSLKWRPSDRKLLRVWRRDSKLQASSFTPDMPHESSLHTWYSRQTDTFPCSVPLVSGPAVLGLKF